MAYKPSTADIWFWNLPETIEIDFETRHNISHQIYLIRERRGRMFSAFKIWSAIVSTYYDQNEYVVHRRQGSKEPSEWVAGLQAEFLDQADGSTNYDSPTDLLVTPTDLVTHTGCSIDTARRRLEEFTEAGLLHRYGHLNTDDDGSGPLYRPVDDDARAVMETLHELNNESSPYTDFTQVTAGDFHHVDNTLFAHSSNPDVVIDVGSPEDGSSIKQSVIEALHEHGYEPSTPRNFVHRLRKDANLIE